MFHFVLQKVHGQRTELAQALKIADENERSDIQENLDFYDANLQGLSQELQLLEGGQFFTFSPMFKVQI